MSNNLIGTWRLASFVYEFVDGEKVEPYSDGQGSLTITPERFTAIFSENPRKPTDDRASLFAGMMACTGSYQLDGSSAVTIVDMAWHPARTGSEETRYFTLDDDRLSVVSGVQENPRYPGRKYRGVINWKREV
jgi:hypothetical protein